MVEKTLENVAIGLIVLTCFATMITAVVVVPLLLFSWFINNML